MTNHTWLSKCNEHITQCNYYCEININLCTQLLNHFEQVEHLFKNFTDINKQKRFLNPLTKSDIKTVTSFIAQSLELNRENTRKNQSFFNRIGDESVLVE